MKSKTAELTGPALDWAVAKCENDHFYKSYTGYRGPELAGAAFYKLCWEGRVGVDFMRYSTSWQEGGPIIEREEIGIRRNAPCSDGRQWEASGSITAKGAGYRWGYGPTPLVAAMRCFVASRLGDTVDIPEELLD